MLEQLAWWLESSRRDEEMGRILMEKGYFEGAVYHLQQSAVKLLKSVEMKKGISSNHMTCVKIMESLAAHNIPTDNVISFARKLDLFYSDSRYPVNGPLSKNFDETMLVELFVCLERIQNFSTALIQD